MKYQVKFLIYNNIKHTLHIDYITCIPFRNTGKDSKERQSQNKKLIFSILIVFHLEISSGNDEKYLSPLNSLLIFLTFSVTKFEIPEIKNNSEQPENIHDKFEELFICINF